MFQPTEKLLLECVRSNGHGITDTLESFVKDRHRIDWLLVAQTIPYVYLKAKNFHEDFKIPNKTLKEIEQIHLSYIVRNELFKHEIKNLAKEFRKAKLDLIFLKGAAIFTTVYGDEDLRIMADIDVLIRKDNLYPAEEILEKIGYQTKETKKKRKIFLEEHFHFKYFKKNIVLELHWDIGEQWHWDIVDSKKHHVDILFSSAKKIRLDDTDIQILSPAHSIFLSCFHFERDLFLLHYRIISTPRIYLSKYASDKKLLVQKSLCFFYEIKKMVEYYGDELNWEDLISLSKMTRKEYEIYTLLFMAEKIAKVGVPIDVVKKMKENIFVRAYIFLSRKIKYDSLNHLFVLNRVIYRIMLVYSYIYNRKIYLLGMRFLGGRI